MEKLICTKVIKSTLTREGVRLGRDNDGKQTYERRRCGAPAAEYEIGGVLARAKAVLCAHHKKQADRESFTSNNGYQFNKIDRRAKENGYHQTRLPGTGILS